MQRKASCREKHHTDKSIMQRKASYRETALVPHSQTMLLITMPRMIDGYFVAKHTPLGFYMMSVLSVF